MDGVSDTDTLSGFEDVIGTPDADVIRGDDSDNVLQGSALLNDTSPDSFQGRGGDDTFIGSGSVAYDDAPAAVDVDLVAGRATGGDGDDTLIGTWSAASGSPFDDHFRVTRRASVSGQEGDDTAMFTGLAHFHGGPGVDLADFSQMSSGVTVWGDLEKWDRWPDSGVPWYQVTDIERYRLTRFQDVAHGSLASEQVSAGGGNDWFALTDQPASETEEPAHDRLLGGRGTDTLIGRWLQSPLVVDLAEGWVHAPGIDVVQNFEDVQGSDQDDQVFGSDTANYFAGYDGDDLLRGRSGTDRLSGGPGIDTLHGGAGSDICSSGPRDTTTSCR